LPAEKRGGRAGHALAPAGRTFSSRRRARSSARTDAQHELMPVAPDVGEPRGIAVARS